jgi:hypothetical protein
MAMTYYALANLKLNGTSYTYGQLIAGGDLSDHGRIRSLLRKGLIAAHGA